jgi:hypothetical protein
MRSSLNTSKQRALLQLDYVKESLRYTEIVVACNNLRDYPTAPAALMLTYVLGQRQVDVLGYSRFGMYEAF